MNFAYRMIIVINILLAYSCTKQDSTNPINSTPTPTISLPKIKTVSVTEILNLNAKITGEAIDDGGSPITAKGICWSTSTGPTIDSSKTNEGAGIGSFTSLITPLKPLVKYYVRAYATNAKGTSYGEEINFTTIYINPIFLDSNGHTIKCYEWAQVGEKGTINGVEYTIVNRIELEKMVKEDGDYTKVCTSKITDMSNMFSGKSAIRDITRFDVSNVVNMQGMFSSAGSFNQDISLWNVSKVTNMNYMFLNNYKFNQNIGKWDVSKVKEMDGMFTYCHMLNQDLSKWNVSNVITMGGMFQGCSNFNGNISTWNLINAKNIRYMFNSCQVFNQDISNWDVRNVTDMEATFAITVKFNQDISKWNVSNVINMKRTFDNANAYNKDLSKWNVSNVINCENFNKDTPFWELPKPNFSKCKIN